MQVQFPYTCPNVLLVGCYELPSSSHVEWIRGRWMLRVQETGPGWHPREKCWEGRWDPVTLQLWRVFFICHQRCLSQISSGPWKDFSSFSPSTVTHPSDLSILPQTDHWLSLGVSPALYAFATFPWTITQCSKVILLGGHSLGPKPIKPPVLIKSIKRAKLINERKKRRFL